MAAADHAEPYRDRFEHEFDEDVTQYEQSVHDEITAAAENVAYNDFQGSVWNLPRKTQTPASSTARRWTPTTTSSRGTGTILTGVR